MVGAVISAYQHLHKPGIDGKINGRNFVVVLTDGEQSTECSNPPVCTDAKGCYEYLVKSESPKAAGPGSRIRTFVIGAPGSDPARTVLSQLAVAGGTAAAGCDVSKGNCHFDMTTTNDFAGALFQRSNQRSDPNEHTQRNSEGLHRSKASQRSSYVAASTQGSGAGDIITSFGDKGPRGPSGAKIFGGNASDPGMPITSQQVQNGLPTPSGGLTAPAKPIKL